MSNNYGLYMKKEGTTFYDIYDTSVIEIPSAVIGKHTITKKGSTTIFDGVTYSHGEISEFSRGGGLYVFNSSITSSQIRVFSGVTERNNNIKMNISPCVNSEGALGLLVYRETKAIKFVENDNGSGYFTGG